MKMNNDRIDEITDAIKKLGEELKLPVIDINAATKKHPEFFSFDGLHPDAGGARLIAETVYEELSSSGI
jgi:lysophospholipase L1-like esterase